MSSFDVLDAIAAAVKAIAAADDDFPSPERNENLEKAFEALQGGVKAYANLVDGDTDPLTEALGAAAGQYERRQTMLLELVVQAPTDAERRAVFKAMLQKLDDAFKVDRTLGDACGWCEIIGIQRLEQATDGLPGLSGITVEIAADYDSDRPY